MLNMFTLLLVCQLAGELLVRFIALPLPGPVLGMLLLFVGLLVRGSVPEALRQTSQFLLGHLSLLFVPAGTGIMLHVARIHAEWLPLLITLLASTFLTLLVTAWVMRLTMGRSAAGGEDERGERE